MSQEIYTGEHPIDPRLVMRIDGGSIHYPHLLLQAIPPEQYTYHNGVTYTTEPIPQLLDVRGRLVNTGKPPVAIIGTRHPTDLGIAMATSLGEWLAFWDRPVVSGLAQGIDRAAHIGALQNNGIPLTVLGFELGRIRLAIAEQIAHAGAIFSQFLQPETNFPIRNQMIVNMSGGVIIPEAGLNGGTHGAALFALACGKPIAICKYADMPQNYAPFYNELVKWPNVTPFGNKQELEAWIVEIVS